MKKYYLLSLLFVAFSCSAQDTKRPNKKLATQIAKNEYISFVKSKAIDVVKSGFNAGDGYGEVWIRDYNTFIELSAEVYPKEALKENLRAFFRLQGNDGNIIDGFIPKDKAIQSKIPYKYIFTDLEPKYAGHKNTVETDHETSLIQAVYKYVKKTGDAQFVNERIGDKTVAQRMESSIEFRLKHR